MSQVAFKGAVMGFRFTLNPDIHEWLAPQSVASARNSMLHPKI